MDNAIRGTAASDERRLSFQMYYGKGIMNIQIENSIKDTPKVRNGIYLTTKSRKEGHGIGLQNVKTRSRKISWSDGDLPYGEILSSENIIIYEIR